MVRFILAILLISTALAVSLYLEIEALSHNQILCPLAQTCTAVINSPLSERLPLRISSLGLGYFFALLGGFVYLSSTPNARLARLWRGLAWTGAATSTFLTGYSLLFVHAACFWCLTIFTCIISLAVLSSVRGFSFAAPSKLASVLLVVVPVLCLLTAVGGAKLLPSLQSDVVLDRSDLPELRRFPLIGTDSATNIGLVADFSCPHCRREMAVLLAEGKSFYLIISVNPLKPESERLQQLFVSARRQGLAIRFCERLPADVVSAEWLEAIRREIGLRDIDIKAAAALKDRAAAWISAHGVKAVPTKILVRLQ